MGGIIVQVANVTDSSGREQTSAVPPEMDEARCEDRRATHEPRPMMRPVVPRPKGSGTDAGIPIRVATPDRVVAVPPVAVSPDPGGPEAIHSGQMAIEHHWWNGVRTLRGRRDVYILSDGTVWKVTARAGGVDGRSRTQLCPGPASAEILAHAWRTGTGSWREVDA